MSTHGVPGADPGVLRMGPGDEGEEVAKGGGRIRGSFWSHEARAASDPPIIKKGGGSNQFGAALGGFPLGQVHQNGTPLLNRIPTYAP